MRSRKILVVDPNSDARQALCTLLQSLGHEVETAGNLDDALRHVQFSTPELVICETTLDDAATGFDLARQLRGRGIYLLAYSGGFQPEQRQMAEDAGFHHYLPKPSTMRDFRLLFEAWDEAEAQGD
jgi:CheY-like chemotaxis protein